MFFFSDHSHKPSSTCTDIEEPRSSSGAIIKHTLLHTDMVPTQMARGSREMGPQAPGSQAPRGSG